MSIKLFGQSQIMKGDETLPVLRQGTNISENVVYVDGKPIKRNSISFCVVANVQPLSGRDLLLVPELDRYKEQWNLFILNDKYFTDESLEVQSDSRLKVQDQINRLGVNYTIQNVENWGSYSLARIMRVDTGPDKTP
jgi:hypothetical protein